MASHRAEPSTSVGRTAPPRLVAIIPVGALDGAKSRLGAVLDAEERLDLTLRLARATIAAAMAAARVDEVLVITPDDTIRALALELGARPIRQRDVASTTGSWPLAGRRSPPARTRSSSSRSTCRT